MNRLLLLVILIVLGRTLAATGEEASAPGAWLHSGMKTGYRLTIDTETRHSGKGSGCLRSTSEVLGQNAFGACEQLLQAKEFRGKRVRLAAFVKTRDVDEWSGLWMRIDLAQGTGGFDNMNDRPIKGTTDWSRYEVVLDVPDDAVDIAVGVLQAGNGQTWIDDAALESVGEEIAVTKPTPKSNNKSGELSAEQLAEREKFAAGLPEAVANADFEQSRLDYDLALMQGVWEGEKHAAYMPPSTYRISKRIDGNRESVIFFDQQGEVLESHTVDFVLEQSGRVTLFTFRNYEVTAGPSKGKKWSAARSFSYIYMVNRDNFVEVLGLLDGDPSLPQTTIWKRAAE